MVERLEQLKKPLDQMTEDELRQHIATVRRDRIMVKRSRGEKKQKAVKKDEGNRQLKKLLDSMSEEEREIFLKELEDGEARD